jgi:hypothetical protein
MKMLPDPNDASRDLWDAGRLLAPGVTPRFRLTGGKATRPLRLWFRVAPAQRARFQVAIDGRTAGEVTLAPSDAWREPTLEVPGALVTPSMEVRLTPLEGGFTLYHLWATQTP